MLDRRLFDLHLHRQARGSLPATRASVLPDDLGDADHVGRNFEEHGEVLDQAVAIELLLGHCGEPEGDDENRGSTDLHWLRASQHDLQHLIVLVKVVGAHSGI